MKNVSDMALDISSLAIQAMMYEATCSPSPGLVSANSQGSHEDMDFYLFIDSTASLVKYFTLCAEKGINSVDYTGLFYELRELGKNAELNMLKKTGGVNTQKGLIFLLGIGCAAGGIIASKGLKLLAARHIIQKMTQGITERELTCIDKNKLPLSHGEELFLKYGVTGIRDEVESGLPIIFDFSLDFYKNCDKLNKNSQLVNTLIGIMQYCQDTNIIYRHSLEVLNEVQERASHIIEIGGMATAAGQIAIRNLDLEFCTRKISPGGSADLLASTVFFSLLEKYLSNNTTLFIV